MTLNNVTSLKNEQISRMPIRHIVHTFANEIWDDCSENHIKRSQMKVEEFAKVIGRDIQLRSITSSHILTFATYLEIEHWNRKGAVYGLSKGSINRYLAAISAVFSWATLKEIIDRAPRIKYRKVEEGRVRYFTLGEIAELKKFFRKSQYPELEHLLELGLKTGMRNAEILGINQTPDSLPENLATYGVIRKKEGRTYVDLRETKTAKPRTVPLTQSAIDALAALDNNPLGAYNEYLFYRTWEHARQRIAPNDPDFVFYVARHTFATNLVHDLKVGDLQVSELMGHKSLSTTKKYSHSKEECSAELLDRLG